jgi:tRNA (guanine-N7-)-methyltransferase
MRRKQLLKDSVVNFPDLAKGSYEDTKAMKGKWSDFFGNDNPIVVDYGCGRGAYIIELGDQNKEINYLGLESKLDRITQACKKMGDVKNVRFAKMEMADLSEVFDVGEISMVNVNCPDPLEKSTQSKKRVTGEDNFKALVSVLGEGGKFRLKTDHRRYFEDALLIAMGIMRIDFLSLDYRNPDNTTTVGYRKNDYLGKIAKYKDPITEFESKWMRMGRPFYVFEGIVE